LPAACAFASIVGHVFPAWHGFRGGKGVATLVGAYAGLQPVLLAPLVASWLAVVVVSGFVGLSSIAASIALPVYLLIRDGARLTPLLGFALACAALVVFTHRGNIRRMRDGTESRARKLWLFGRGRT
jgi:glycerol-3-phosphate acyltransferase PlsY